MDRLFWPRKLRHIYHAWIELLRFFFFSPLHSFLSSGEVGSKPHGCYLILMLFLCFLFEEAAVALPGSVCCTIALIRARTTSGRRRPPLCLALGASGHPASIFPQGGGALSPAGGRWAQEQRCVQPGTR